MAQRKHQLVGLDIDPAGVAVAQVAVNGHVEVERAAFAELEPGVVRDGEVVDAEALTRRPARRSGATTRAWTGASAIGIANQKIAVRARRAAARRGPQGPRGGACASRPPTRSRCRSTPRSSTSIRSASSTPARGPRQRVVVVAARRDMVEPPPARRPQRGPAPRGRRPGRLRAGPRPAPPGRLARRADRRRARPLPVGRRPDEPRGRPGQHLRVHPRRRRRPGGDRRRARRAPAPDARPRPRPGSSTSASRPRSRRSRASADIVEDARDVLVDGVRRVAAEVRSSLDFHEHPRAVGRGRPRRPDRPGRRRCPGSPTRSSGELGLPVTSRHVEARPAGVDAAAASPSRPAWPSRRSSA